MKKFLFSLFVLFTSISVQAQITFGPKIGLNVSYQSSTYAASYSGDGFTSQSKPGFQIGAACNVTVMKYFSIRPELLFNSIGGILNSNQMRSTETLNYIALPVHFAGTFRLGPGKLNVFFGPQLSIGVGGKYKHEVVAIGTETGAIKPAKVPEPRSGNNEYYNPFDLALNYGVGYQVNHLLLTVQYSTSLTSNQAHYENATLESYRDNYMSYNRVFTFGLTYFFGDIE